MDEVTYSIAKSEMLIQKNMQAEAMGIIDDVLKTYPDNSEALKLKIELLIHNRAEKAMILDYIKKLKKVNKTELIHYLTAQTHDIDRNEELIKKELNKLSRKNPNSPYIFKINEILYGRQQKAKLKTNESVQLEPVVNKGHEDISLEEALKKLDDFIGLDNVKKEIRKIVSVAKINIERNELLNIDSGEKDSYHFMFYGNPGTGKTTVARVLGDIFHALGIIEKPDVVEVDRSDLVGDHIGETAVKTRKIIKMAMGGVLFIDEAYALAREGAPNNDFGAEAIDTLLKAMEDNRDKFIVILAGYEDKMKNLFNVNEGLESRVNKHIYFENYDEQALLAIARQFAGKKHYTMTEEAELAFLMKIDSEQVKSNFSNARSVRNIIEEAIQNRALRLINTDYSQEQLKMIEAEDFGIDPSKMFSDNTDELLDELDQYIGLHDVKLEVRRLINNIKANKKREEAGIKVNQQSYHMVFHGNPGTGKTMVARHIGKLFKALGILKRGQVIEASRQDLVAQYIGHTANKTKRKIQEAYGGILFIDEAYSLNSGGQNDFGKEAVDVLIQEMEENREKLVVIMAGYTEDMNELFKLNQGLKSRITYRFEFNNYTSEEIAEILMMNGKRAGYPFEEACFNLLERLIHKITIHNASSDGNGRLARKLFEALERIQGERIVNNEHADASVFTVEDVNKLSANYK